MKLGFQSANTLDDRPDVLARQVEERGFESLWLGEHTHIPSSRATPNPAGEPLPDFYRRMLDPFVALMAAAGATTTLRLGTAVTLPLQHHPINLAKETATLDQLSGGRLLLGVGVGWNVEELATHSDVPWRLRYEALAEHVEALVLLWTAEEAEYHGRFVDFDPLWLLPKPAQAPHPPVICGMAGRLGTKHAIRWGDGWMPIDAGQDMVKKLARFRSALEEAGRDPAGMEITVSVLGDPEAQVLERYRELGVARVLVGGNRAGSEDSTSLPAYLDRYAALVPALAA